jgi:hypothetical protein
MLYSPIVEKTFRFRDVKWKPIMAMREATRVKTLRNVEGPLCLEDSAGLNFESDNSTKAKCPLCEREYSLILPQQQFRELAYKAYQASLDNNLETISLDDPIQPIKARDEDDSYWVEAKLGHASDGRKIAVVYIGDKKRNTKVQNFIDLDNEQLRSDKADAKPYEVVSKIKVEFLNSTHIITKK